MRFKLKFLIKKKDNILSIELPIMEPKKTKNSNRFQKEDKEVQPQRDLTKMKVFFSPNSEFSDSKVV